MLSVTNALGAHESIFCPVLQLKTRQERFKEELEDEVDATKDGDVLTSYEPPMKINSMFEVEAEPLYHVRSTRFKHNNL